MNVHHLELFYYVAKHGGISAAVRKIPYGIQQPAVSGQVGNLEKELGVKLFERSPFRLTAAGERLFAHVQPFFEGLAGVASEVRAATRPELRICGAELVLRDHLPAVLKQMKTRFPKLQFSLRTTGFQSQVEEWLREGQADVALLPVYDRIPAGLRMMRLASFPLVLQVPKASKLKSAAELFAQKRIAEPLICLEPRSNVVQRFFQELKTHGASWPHVVEATSLDLVTRYVANGDGIGLNVLVDRKARLQGVKIIPLPGFSPLTMGALWRGQPSDTVQAVIAGVRQYAKATWPDWVCAE
ncbi:MAG TPA: LysR family transcriptional regulator [Lacunisphaera sp.]|nr:LysR family transcriptional regulator [Lacunisphaera sp.]